MSDPFDWGLTPAQSLAVMEALLAQCDSDEPDEAPTW